jgi:hypothetical protein
LSKRSNVEKKKNGFSERVPVMPTQFEAEIVVAESNAKVSNKLMEMFEQLAVNPQKKPMSKLQRWLVWLILL